MLLDGSGLLGTFDPLFHKPSNLPEPDTSSVSGRECDEETPKQFSTPSGDIELSVNVKHPNGIANLDKIKT